MKIEMEYVDSLPLRRLEKDDKVVISVFNPLPTDTKKNTCVSWKV